jgi:hypothetical protein
MSAAERPWHGQGVNGIYRTRSETIVCGARQHPIQKPETIHCFDSSISLMRCMPKFRFGANNGTQYYTGRLLKVTETVEELGNFKIRAIFKQSNQLFRHIESKRRCRLNRYFTLFGKSEFFNSLDPKRSFDAKVNPR